MSASAPPLEGLQARRAFPARIGPKGNLIYRLITTTDHKLIGIMYIVACFTFFFVGGLMALLMRAELREAISAALTCGLSLIFLAHGQPGI